MARKISNIMQEFSSGNRKMLVIETNNKFQRHDTQIFYNKYTFCFFARTGKKV